MLVRELYEERKEGKFISPPGNTVGLNVFELSPSERQSLNGTVVYHQTKKLDKIMQSGGLRPRADISGENSFARHDMLAGKDWRTPKGIFVSMTAKNWFGNEIAFKIEPTDKIYRAYNPEQGHILITNPIPVDRFISINNEPVKEGKTWDRVKNTAAAGTMAAALGYGALTGQLRDKPQAPVVDPIQTTQAQKVDKPIQPEVEPEQEKVSKPQENPMPSTVNTADPEMEKIVFSAAWRSGLRGEELAQFMAQTAHETLGFQRMVEQGDKEYFKKYDPKYSPQKAKILGNINPGDGARYKGRGFIQITGRYNYKQAGKALNLPLEEKPQLASDPKVAAQIALWYWKTRVKNAVDDYSDTIGVTSRINPSMSGLGDRDLNFHKYLERLKPIMNRG